MHYTRTKPLTGMILVLGSLLFARNAMALGLNCKGHGCAKHPELSPPVSSALANVIHDTIISTRLYYEQEPIACYFIDKNDKNANVYCVFLNGTYAGYGSAIRDLVRYIPAHNCETCGEVPWAWPKDDVSVSGSLKIDRGKTCEFDEYTLRIDGKSTYDLCK